MSINMGDTNSEAPPIDIQYTGHILVSGYNISFVLPKVFLSPLRNGGLSDNEEGGFSRTTRRPSAGDRSQAHFMAAIELWVPFLCMPPRSPYLVGIFINDHALAHHLPSFLSRHLDVYTITSGYEYFLQLLQTLQLP